MQRRALAHEDHATGPRELAGDVTDAAEARKRGGKTVKMQGKMSKLNAGRMPRKSGGRTGSNMNPLSSAHSGTPAKGRSSKQLGC